MEVDPAQTDYISSYEDLEIHKLMLEDKPRTESYQKAILSNKEFFRDKVVMDVGCGTGILSIFCAQAGAKKVYAVEASNLASLAREVVKENGYDEIIEVIQSRVEDLNLPNNTKVDAIVSEWMGFYLLHEGMLDSVIVARDKFLKEDGLMFPESACLYIAPCSVPSLYDDWSNIHGVSMSTFAKHLRNSKGSKPEIITVEPEHLLGNEVAVLWIDLKNDRVEDLDTFSFQQVVATKQRGQYQGLCIWFNCTFPTPSSTANTESTSQNTVPLATSPTNQPTVTHSTNPTITIATDPTVTPTSNTSDQSTVTLSTYPTVPLSTNPTIPLSTNPTITSPTNTSDQTAVILGTGPADPPTHWKQTVIVLPQEHEVVEGEPIAFQLDISRDSSNKRRYNLQLTLLDPEEVEHPLPCDCYLTKCILIKTYMLDHPNTNVPVNGRISPKGQGDMYIEEDIMD